MSIQIEQPGQRHRVCSYTFHDYQSAARASRDLAILVAGDVKVAKSNEEFRVKFKASWSIEQQAIQAIPEEAGSFRTGSPYSKEESELICEMYFSWHEAAEIAAVVRRSKSAVVRFLEDESLLIAFPNRDFYFRWNDLFGHQAEDDDFWENEFSPIDGFSEDLAGMLWEAGAIADTAGRLFPGEGSSFLPLKALSNNEIDNIYFLLCKAGKWKHLKKIALCRGTPIEARRWLRREFCANPIEFFQALVDEEGLPMEILYQRELARAYWAWNLVNGYSKSVAAWVEAAKLRATDYYAKELTAIPRALKHPDLSCNNPIVRALAVSDNETALESLANEDNRLAAAILADGHRRRMRHTDYPLDAAYCWTTIQDGYWPTESEVRDAIASSISYDPQYAERMAHLGFTSTEKGRPEGTLRRFKSLSSSSLS